jgi:hypothetical protein
MWTVVLTNLTQQGSLFSGCHLPNLPGVKLSCSQLRLRHALSGLRFSATRRLNGLPGTV